MKAFSVRLMRYTVGLAVMSCSVFSRSVSFRFHSPNLAQKPSAGQSPSGSTRQTWRRNPQQVSLPQVPLGKPGAETLSRSVSLRFHSPNLAQKPSAGQSPSGSTRQTWRRNPQQVSLPQVPLAKPGAATRRWDRHGAAGSVGQPPLWPGSRTRACRHALLHATMQAQATRKPARGRTPRPPPHAALVMHGREVRLRNLLARSPCPSGQGRAARPRGGARRAAART